MYCKVYNISSSSLSSATTIVSTDYVELLNFRREWNHFLQRFSSAPQNLKALDEPVLSLQRNVFCSKREEQGVKDHKVLELLYEEAKYNMLTSRYPCEISDYIMLGGIQV